MNILGVDFGTKRIGLAWAQTGLDVVLPFGVITEATPEAMCAALVQMIEKERIDVLVFGLPVTLDTGEENANTKRVRAFAAMVGARVTIPIYFMDERLTSFEADEMGGTASRDEKAAMVILQSYLAEEYEK